MHAVDAEYYASARRDARDRERDRADAYPRTHLFPRTIQPAQPGWRPRYYHALFGAADGPSVQAACRAWLQAVAWSLGYHTGGALVDGGWFYPHHYAPLAQDVANALAAAPAGHMAALAAEVAGQPPPSPSPSPLPATVPAGLTPAVLLLAVLPAASFGLLPDARLAAAVTAAGSGCAHYYPVAFRVLTYLRRYASECGPVLPALDLPHLVRTVAALCPGDRAGK